MHTTTRTTSYLDTITRRMQAAARAGTRQRYERPAMVDVGADASDASDASDHFHDLAHFYASHWNDLAGDGLEPTEAALWKAEQELAAGDWVVYFDADADVDDQEIGEWRVANVDDFDPPRVVAAGVDSFARQPLHGFGPFRYAASSGGGTGSWVAYTGKPRGKDKAIARGWKNTATGEIRYQVKKPDDTTGREKVLKKSSGGVKKQGDGVKKRPATTAPQPVDESAMHAKLAPHAGRDLSAKERASAKKSFAALVKAHGAEKVLDRIGELVGETTDAGKLRQLKEMVEWARGEGGADAPKVAAKEVSEESQEDAIDFIKAALGSKNKPKTADEALDQYKRNTAVGRSRGESFVDDNKFRELWDLFDHAHSKAAKAKPSPVNEPAKPEAEPPIPGGFKKGQKVIFDDDGKETEVEVVGSRVEPAKGIEWVRIKKADGRERHARPESLTKAKPPKSAKEPWQLTRHEVLESIRQPGRKATADPGNMISTGKGILSSGMTVSGIPASEIPGWDKALEQHREDVMRAIAEGKDVPAAVKESVAANSPNWRVEVGGGTLLGGTSEGFLTEEDAREALKKAPAGKSKRLLGWAFGGWSEVDTEGPPLSKVKDKPEPWTMTRTEYFPRFSAGPEHLAASTTPEEYEALKKIKAAQSDHKFAMPPVADTGVDPKMIRKLAEKEYIKLFGAATSGAVQMGIVGSMAQHAVEQDKIHRESVKAAVASGKPVPMGVLADYPDLVPKAEADAVAAVGDDSQADYETKLAEYRATSKAISDEFEAKQSALSKRKGIASRLRGGAKKTKELEEIDAEWQAAKDDRDKKYAESAKLSNELAAHPWNRAQVLKQKADHAEKNRQQDELTKKRQAEESAKAKETVASAADTDEGNLVDKWFTKLNKEALESDRFKNQTKEEQDAGIARAKAGLLEQIQKSTVKIQAKDVSLALGGALDPRNPMTRDLFTMLTGIKLPAGVGATNEAVREYIGKDKLQAHADASEAERAAAQAEIDAKKTGEHTKQMEKMDWFGEGLNPMQRKKAHDVLEANVRQNGVVTTRQALVKQKIDEGAIVEKVPGGTRRLIKPDGVYLDETQISKTAMDYAEHLLARKAKKPKGSYEAAIGAKVHQGKVNAYKKSIAADWNSPARTDTALATLFDAELRKPSASRDRVAMEAFYEVYAEAGRLQSYNHTWDEKEKEIAEEREDKDNTRESLLSEAAGILGKSEAELSHYSNAQLQEIIDNARDKANEAEGGGGGAISTVPLFDVSSVSEQSSSKRMNEFLDNRVDRDAITAAGMTNHMDGVGTYGEYVVFPIDDKFYVVQRAKQDGKYVEMLLEVHKDNVKPYPALKGVLKGGAGSSVPSPVPKGKTVLDIKREIREHKKDMKDRGIQVSSMMNRHPSIESARANERLFALKVELEKAEKEEEKQRAESPKKSNISSPLIAQYNEFKAHHPDNIGLFRVGDFYEIFGADAETAAKTLGLTVTSRTDGGGEKVAMAGFPHHQLETYLHKMLAAGHRVAILDPVGPDAGISSPRGVKVKESAPWHANRENVLSAMRTLDESVQHDWKKSQELGPRGGTVSVGSADFDHTLKATVGGAYLRALNAGSTPDDAHKEAVAAGNDAVQKWNTTGHKGRAAVWDHHELKRWEKAGESIADDTHRHFKAMVEAGGKAPTSAPTKPRDNPIIRDIGGLSSGTLANLFGTGNMAEIDTKHADWQQWAAKRPEKFETWQDAWAAYSGELPKIESAKAAKASTPNDAAYADALARNMAEMKADPAYNAKDNTYDPAPLNYNVILKALQNVMSAKGRERTVGRQGGLADLWHYPLASYTPAMTFGQVVLGMYQVAEMRLKDDAGPYEVRSNFLGSHENTFNRTSEQITHTLDGFRKKQFPIITQHADSLDQMADDLTALEPNSGIPQKLRDKAKSLRDRMGLKEMHLTGEIERKKETEAAEERRREKDNQFKSDFGAFKIPKVNTKKLARFVQDGFAPSSSHLGYATDGKFLVKIGDKEKQAVEEAETIKESSTGAKKRPLTQDFLDKILGEKTLGPAKIVGMREKEEDSAPRFLLQGSGTQAVVDSRYHTAITTRFPDAVPHLGEREGAPIVYHSASGGGVVGAVVPLNDPFALKNKYKVDDTPIEAPKISAKDQAMKELTEKAKPISRGVAFPAFDGVSKKNVDVIGDSFGHFGITKSKDEKGDDLGWAVVHIPTGTVAGTYDTKRDASIAAIVTQAGAPVPARERDVWAFTDPKEITAQQVNHGRNVAKLVKDGDYEALAKLFNHDATAAPAAIAVAAEATTPEASPTPEAAPAPTTLSAPTTTDNVSPDPTPEPPEPAPEEMTQADFVKKKIEDFGEKLGGARKDMAAKKDKDAPRTPKKEKDSEITGWETRYEVGQIAGSTSTDADKWLGGVSKKVAELKSTHSDLLLKKTITDRFRKGLASGELKNQAYYDELVANGTILDNAKYDEAVAVEKQIEAARATPMASSENGKWCIRDKKLLDRWSKKPKQVGRVLFDTEAAAKAAIPLIEVARNHSVTNNGTTEKPNYAIYRKISDRKRPVVKDGFQSYDEAAKYMATNPREIIETKVRIDDSIHPALEEINRVGKDYRDGKPAKPEDFKEFGFRGVEFGNWNNNAERQHILNHAYDSFRGLADVLGIDPKDVSLNGELGLGFGSRGHGLSGARAHYETDYATINLTKIKGAGSLAHEWMHALDHHLGRLSGKASSEKITNSSGDQVYKTSKSPAGDFVSHGHGWKIPPAYKPELKQAFDDVVEAIHHRKVKYVEDKSLHEKRMEHNTKYLEDSIKSFHDELVKDHTGAQYTRLRGKYQKPATAAQMKEVGELFDKIRAGDVGEEVELPNKMRYGGPRMPQVYARLNEIFKEVRGRNAWYKDANGRITGSLVDIKAFANRKKDGDKFLEEAKEQKEKEKTVKTEFYSHAKRMDDGTVKDYWCEPHELMARAFEAYVYDKLKEKDKKDRDDFLAYEKHNDMPMYRMFNVKPYPEKEERESMNAAFENLFKVVREAEKAGGK